MTLTQLLPRASIIVSCQAEDNTPTNSTDMMVAFARSAAMGGAQGLRLNSAAHVQAVRAVTNLPIIAIDKTLIPNAKVLITGDHAQIAPLVEAGAEIIAFDATTRARPSSLKQIIATIHDAGALALADIQHIGDVEAVVRLGVDAIATTLSVWDLPEYVPNIDLIRAVQQECDLPIIAEGNYWKPEDVQRAFAAGAYAVVIGSAITRPWRITEYYVRHTR